MKNRILINSGSALTDLSTNLNDYFANTSVVNLTTSAAIYIGQTYPFNHLYFKTSVVNTTGATFTVKLWDGDSWTAVAELIDETSAFTKSGYMTWTPDKNESWIMDDTVDSAGNEQITGLGDIKIYDRYWIQITTDTSIDNTTALQWAGNLFATDNDIKAEYPELLRSTYLAAWESGKTTWEEQRVKASEILLNDLITKRIIKNSAQVLDRYVFVPALVSLASELIFSGLGDDYEDQRALAFRKYRERIKLDIYNKDENNNARLDPKETRSRQGMLKR